MEIAPHVFLRHYHKLMEDDVTPLCRALQQPFQHGPSSTFEVGTSIVAHEPVLVSNPNMVRNTRPRFDIPLNHNDQLIQEFISWIQEPMVPNPEPVAPNGVVHESAHGLDHQQIRYEPSTVIPNPNPVHMLTPLDPQQHVVSCSLTQGPALPQQTIPEPAIPCETTHRSDISVYPHQTEVPSTWNEEPNMSEPWFNSPLDTFQYQDPVSSFYEGNIDH